MNDLNSVVLGGRLTRDSETKYTAGGLAVCNFSIANNQSKKSGDGWEMVAYFYDVAVFGKMAETLGQYLVKGKQITLVGELSTDRWEKDGVKHEKVKIRATSIQLGHGGDTHSSKPSDSETTTVADGFADDIPF
jgi:single-strand DNA-binding protein